jgi:hypothetical protein
MPVSTIQNASLASGVPARSNMPAGSVIQTVNATWAGSSLNTSSSTWIGAEISITTTVANSKIFVELSAPSQLNNSATVRYYLSWRSSLNSYGNDVAVYPIAIDSGWYELPSHFAYFHSPAQPAGTAITYRLYGARQSGSGALYMYDSWGYGSALPITAMEIA